MDKLLQEFKALMNVIGDFVEQIRDAVTELALSRGVGENMKDLLVFVYQIIG